MQKITVMGFVGRDPEEKFTSNNKKLVTFPLGINTSKNGEKLTIWYRINCWEGQCTKLLPYIKKGSCVIVMGDLSTPTTYQNKNGDISIDMSISAFSLSFGPSNKKEENKENEVEAEFFSKENK